MPLVPKTSAPWLALAFASALAGCATAPDREVVSTPNAPAAIGPYSQAIAVGPQVFLSGQIPLHPTTGEVNLGSIEAQTRQVLDNLQAVLAARQLDLSHVVSTTVYLKDLNEFSRMNAVYATYFKDRPPARATVQVARLPRDVSIEISAIAVR